LSEVLESDAAIEAKFTLSNQKWAKIQQSKSYRLHPEYKLADLNGIAGTVISSYKSGYLMTSQFVPQSGGKNPRLFTPRECARLQGFPDRFEFEGVSSWYKLIGNAVSPPIVALIAGSILCAVQHRGRCQLGGVHAALYLVVQATPSPATHLLHQRPLRFNNSLITLSDLSLMTNKQCRSTACQSCRSNPKQPILQRTEKNNQSWWRVVPFLCIVSFGIWRFLKGTRN